MPNLLRIIAVIIATGFILYGYFADDGFMMFVGLACLLGVEFELLPLLHDIGLIDLDLER